MVRAVSSTSLEPPLLHTYFRWIDRFRIDRACEIQFDTAFKSPHLQRQIAVLGKLADSIQPTRGCRIARPRKHPAQVQMVIPGRVSPSHDPGRKGRDRQLDHPSLTLPWRFSLHLFMQHQIHLAIPIREIQQTPLQLTPCRTLDPKQLRRRSIESIGDPTQRRLHRLIGRIGHVMVPKHIAIKFWRCTLLDCNPVDPILGIPKPFLVGDDEGPVRIQTNPIGRSETRRQNVGLGTVGRDPEQRAMLWHHGLEGMPPRLGIIKIPLLIHLQSHREFMEMLRDLMVVVETLDVVDVVVRIEIMQRSKLVATSQIHLIFNDFDSQRLVQTRDHPLPCPTLRVERFSHMPNIAIPSRHSHRAIGEEIQTRQPHLRKPWIGFRRNNRVDSKRSLGKGLDRSCLEHLLPALRLNTQLSKQIQINLQIFRFLRQ